MKTSSKKLIVLGSIAAAAVSLIGCASNAPTTTPTPGPSNDPNVVLPPRGRPNLRIGAFEATPRADGSIRIEVEVANTGLGPARTNSVTRVVHIPANGRAVQLIDLPTPVLGAGRAVKLIGNVPAGQIAYSSSVLLRARADASRGLDEGAAGEKDNFADKEIAYGPDLTIVGLAKAPTSTKDPKNLQLSATLGNGGNVNTGAFTAVWEFHAKSAPVGSVDPKQIAIPKWEPLEKIQVPSIAPGKTSAEIKLGIDAAKAKALQLNGKNVVVRLLLDPENNLKELRSDNNRKGAAHSFPPDLPDIGVIALVAFPVPNQPVFRLFPILVNSGDAQCPPFESQWFRLPGNGAEGNLSAQANDPAAPWAPLSPVLQHTGIKPNTWELDPVNNAKVPEFAWTPDVRDEGDLVVLKFEADIGNKVQEFTDPEPGAANPNAASNTNNANNANNQNNSNSAANQNTADNANSSNTNTPNGPNNTSVAANTPNGPNNIGIWNFQVPRLPRADLSVRGLRARLSQDKAKILVDTAFSNQGSIHTGPFKLIATADGKATELNLPGVPPTSRLYYRSFSFPVTSAMRVAGNAAITVKLQGSKQERDDKDNSVTRRINVPRDRDPADILVYHSEIFFLRSGKDKENPNRVDQVQVRYYLWNTGDEPTGPFQTNVSIEGGPGAQIPDEDGIPGNSFTVRQTEPLDISSLGKPVGFTPLQARVTTQCEADKNDSNNSNLSNIIKLPPRPPEKPAGLPDLHVMSIGLRPTSSAKKVEMAATIVNLGEADSPMFRVDWYVNEEYQKKPGGQDWAPGIQRGASIDNFDAVWCDYVPKPTDGTKLRVMVVADPFNQVREEKVDASNDLDGEIDINDKGAGPQIECLHHNAPLPATQAE